MEERLFGKKCIYISWRLLNNKDPNAHLRDWFSWAKIFSPALANHPFRIYHNRQPNGMDYWKEKL
jgi:hypothetical protein